jgi:hypothetical protein
MASKRRVKRREALAKARRLEWEQKLQETGCIGKKRHPTQGRAVAHLISLERATGHKLHTYKCRFCQCWHIGHD